MQLAFFFFPFFYPRPKSRRLDDAGLMGARPEKNVLDGQFQVFDPFSPPPSVVGEQKTEERAWEGQDALKPPPLLQLVTTS